jgi:uncharacterized protein with GYD domain
MTELRPAPADLPTALQDVVNYRKSGLSLNHVVGCPLDCGYCVRHLFANYEMKRPHLVMDDRDAVELLIQHWAFRSDATPVQIFNRATDPFSEQPQEDQMPTFMLSLNWTDQGIRKVKDAPKRNKAAKELAKKIGIEIKHVYLTSGDDDLVLIVDTPNGNNVAKFALAIGSLGNVRTRTVRAWPESEFLKLISELP